MGLIDQIDKKRKEIRTDGYPLSIGVDFTRFSRRLLNSTL
jgi:hypothetical protein